MQSLMRITDVAEYLRTTPGAARNWLARHSVPVIDLGRGRGLGLRWKAIHVQDAVHASMQEKKSGEPKAKRKNSGVTGIITGRSRSELLAELTNTSALQ